RAGTAFESAGASLRRLRCDPNSERVTEECQSKLALVMFTFDLAALLEGTGVTANAIHPATFMNTRMVTEAGIQPRHTVEDGADAILHLAAASELEGTSGAFFDGMRESRADPEAYHARARQRLRTLSLELAGVSADVAR